MMKITGLRDLISHRVPVEGMLLADTGREVGFVTLETLITFPGATSAITMLWKLAKAVTDSSTFFHTQLFPVITAFLVGLFIYAVQFTDPKAADKSTRTRLLQIAPALFNAATLAFAVIGVETAT